MAPVLYRATTTLKCVQSNTTRRSTIFAGETGFVEHKSDRLCSVWSGGGERNWAPAFVFVVVSERLWSELTVSGDGKWRDE